LKPGDFYIFPYPYLVFIDTEWRPNFELSQPLTWPGVQIEVTQSSGMDVENPPKCPHNLYSHLWIIYENFIHHIHHINHHLWMLRSWSFARSWTQQPRLEIFLSGPLKINSGCWFIDVYRVIYIYNIYI
jgi:hypothetical protein